MQLTFLPALVMCFTFVDRREVTHLFAGEMPPRWNEPVTVRVLRGSELSFASFRWMEGQWIRVD
jgi:hypothetical protein